jgi:DNA-binding beta-propeller fold protein YncE
VLGAFDTLDAQDVAAAGNYAYVADGNRGLRVIDVADPTHPAEVGYYIPPNLNHWANGVAVVGNFVYVAEDKAGLQGLLVRPAGGGLRFRSTVASSPLRRIMPLSRFLPALSPHQR